MPEASIYTLLKSHFGYDGFRPLQEEIIENALSQRDSLVLMSTGGGKSLCYQLPALVLGGLTLVISPLIALMKDQVDALRANGIAAAFINSTLTASEASRIYRQTQAGQVKILYLAPERLTSPGFQDFLQTLNISLIAIDEAHCISEWGHEFRPDYRNLKALRRQFPQAPVIALTATATERVRQDIVTQLGLDAGRVFQSSFNRPNLSYTVKPKRDSFQELLDLLELHRGEPAIIYCFSRRDTEELAADLSNRGFAALPYHAGLDSAVRQETQEKFIRDQAPVIVATIAFGMGIDKPDIRLVVHRDLPKSVEGYYQETGRAGRDGLPSECVLFYSYGDKVKQDFFINRMEDATEKGNAEEKLARMVEFCETPGCRRRFLLSYFGEEHPEDNCGGCDVCVTPREEFDATEIAQKILSAVIRTGERFGANHVIGVLRGARTKRIQETGHDKLSVYGIAPDFTQEELREIINSLLARHFLLKNEGQYPTFAVSQAGRGFLQRRETLTLSRAQRRVVTTPAQDAPALEYDQALFQELRGLRRRIAEEKSVPPYVVFGDASLREMAAYLPQTLESFGRINGVGTAKLEEYGERFLAAIVDHARPRGLGEKPIPGRRRERESSRTAQRSGSTHEETKRLFGQKLTIHQIAQQRGLSEGTIIGHLERLALAGKELDLGHVLPPPEYLDRIVAAFQAHGAQFLAPVRDSLRDAHTYEELRLVRIYLRQRERLDEGK